MVDPTGTNAQCFSAHRAELGDVVVKLRRVAEAGAVHKRLTSGLRRWADGSERSAHMSHDSTDLC